ncbi:amidase [Pseudomonas fontis]|uniref:Amidase n=1 Tax=Pseudomonas fontis TaxID=2942633 RepID=A0ABT5NPB4_9PSED|nr:amidase [Pseudomonas fontis]MDD0974478.1 amidase [Pseudomonas fontis]MDD0990020.1 amidase [Pseudomonas fontis]
MKRIVLLVLLVLGAWAWYERQALEDFPDILSAYSAKEYCSCRYVMGFDAAYCQGYVQQYLPLSRLEDEPPAQRVIAEGLGRRNTAVWLGPREGCRLLP